MVSPLRPGWLIVFLGVCVLPAAGQQESKTEPAPPPTSAIAATVNGQTIPELALFRATVRFPADKRKQARAEFLDFFISNLLIDQHLTEQKIAVDKKEVDARLEQIKAEVKKEGGEFAAEMKRMYLTEEELRSQIQAVLRWDAYCATQVNEKVLREWFAKNVTLFDGSLMRARHILLTPAPGNAQAAEQAKVKLTVLKKSIEEQVAQGLAKLPANTDNLAKEKARIKLIDEAFAAAAAKESECPSKEQGGDLSWFPRSGKMVEPFARAAFALKPYQMSDIVETQFGYHLILAMEQKPGKEVKFEDIKNAVKAAYCEQLHDTLSTQLRQKAHIVIHPAPKE
jgi:parvulin-like peptidyl-prolyl isomerase